MFGISGVFVKFSKAVRLREGAGDWLKRDHNIADSCSRCLICLIYKVIEPRYLKISLR